MTKKFIFLTLMLCTSIIIYAQVEQTATDLAESHHKAFATELTNALTTGKGKPVFSIDSKDKQFLLEDKLNVFTDLLGWKKSAYDKRTLKSTYKDLLKASKQKDAKKKVSVKVNLPVSDVEYKGQVKDRRGNVINDWFVVTTKSEATIEATKQGFQPSVAKNILTFNWEVLVVIDKKGAVNTKSSRAILQSIDVKSSTGFFQSEQEDMQEIAERLIRDYYQALRDGRYSSIEVPSQWRTPMQNSPKRETEGNISVPLPNSKTFDVKTVPNLNIFVDSDAFHKVSLAFSISIDDNMKSGSIVGVDYFELAKPIIKAPPPPDPDPIPDPPITKPVPTETGITYKVQVLGLSKHVPIESLPAQFRIDNLIIEKYAGEELPYKYVVPAGTTRNEALSVQRRLLNSGLEDVWIAIYQDGVRINPNQGMPEILR